MRRPDPDPLYVHAHPSEADEDFYDWLAEKREADASRRVTLIIVTAAVIGGLLGIFILVFLEVA